MKAKCPFKTGDLVVYRPSDHGYYEDPPNRRLVRGQVYRIAQVRGEGYVIVEGYTHPGGGLLWTEFELVKKPL